MAGQVIGVNTQIESDSGGNEGVGFAVPSSTISSVVSKLVKGEKVQHPYLGVYVQAANRSGAAVGQVKSCSAAASAGRKAGVVILGLVAPSAENATARSLLRGNPLPRPRDFDLCSGRAGVHLVQGVGRARGPRRLAAQISQ